MKKNLLYFILLMMALHLQTSNNLWAQDKDIKTMSVCNSCGMSREVFAHSRMLIEFNDGKQTGLCSLRCTALELAANPGRKPKVIRVADYNTRRLLSADEAFWVIGGKQMGVMTKRAKWAFGDKAAAEAFVAANGGFLASFDAAMKAAFEDMYDDTKAMPESGGDRMKGHSHGGHDMGHHMSHMGPGAQMLFNPAFGDQIYHNHPADMWMVNYKFMRMAKHGLRAGTDNVDQNSVSPAGHKPFGYMMTPTNMTMDMQMLMVMYGLTDRLTLMAMGSYQAMNMDMLMNMGAGNVNDPPMMTNGIGDTEIRGMYGLSKNWVLSLGASLPTGDIRQKISMMGYEFRAPYDMQLGSGTVDLKPAITYSALSSNALWNWGAQAQYNAHIKGNNSNYALGDGIRLTTWLQRAFGRASTWFRLAYSDTGRISGRDPEIQKLLYKADPSNTRKWAPTPDADPDNYGGQELDVLVGASYLKGPFSFGVEFGLPAYQNLNGLQLKTEWMFNIGIQAMF